MDIGKRLIVIEDQKLQTQGVNCEIEKSYLVVKRIHRLEGCCVRHIAVKFDNHSFDFWRLSNRILQKSGTCHFGSQEALNAAKKYSKLIQFSIGVHELYERNLPKYAGHSLEYTKIEDASRIWEGNVTAARVSIRTIDRIYARLGHPVFEGFNEAI